MTTSIENVMCPECGVRMVPRNGKFGKFWGCPNYPKCKGTRDSMGLSKEDRWKEKNSNEEE